MATHPEIAKEGLDHQTVVIFTKENTEVDKPIPVANLTPVRFVGGP